MSRWGGRWGNRWGGRWGQVTTGTPITNSGATTSLQSNYEICPVSGFKLYPRGDRLTEYRKRWDGQWVRAESLDPRHPQEFIRSRGNEPQRGPKSPEPDDVFISTAVTPDDL